MASLFSSNQYAFSRNVLMPQEEKLETGKKHQKLIIGIPKEEDENESRISLTPFAVEQLVNYGHAVIIERGAGLKANFSDTEYSEVGAIIANSKKEVLQCDIIIKVSPLSDEEIEGLKGNQIVFTTLHYLLQERKYFDKLQQKKITAFAFEYIQDLNNCYTIVRSMSEIAGSTSILIAAEYLSNVHNGKGELLGGITGVNSTKVVILGAGTAGEFAARTALGLGANVKVFDHSAYRLRRLHNNIGHRLNSALIQPRLIAKSLKTADVVIGAIRIEENQHFFISEDIVKQMKKNAVIVDISIDQGGCFETSHITTHKNPVFQKHGVIHYCVPNIPSRVARTASYAISNIFAPLLLELADAGSLNNMLKDNQGFRNGIYLYNGILTKSFIGNRFDIPSKDINLLLAAF
ncbi:MAG: alanine dehydrogenase [Marinilabiliales bacterium]